MEENPDREIKKAHSALQYVRTNFLSMMSEERLDSVMTEVPIIYFCGRKLLKFSICLNHTLINVGTTTNYNLVVLQQTATN